ncbi:MAG: mitochondrial 37S ribosomal protein nam9 [Chaenotheca gracillima]|nr:MAG: mitochondrial 37S ribosomal protein nam9 [Chaenotheca gracillima]
MVGQRALSDEEDRAEVEVLFAHLEKTKQLSKKIQASSNQLETSGRNVQAAIGPIYGDTQRLQTVGTNIDRIIAAIETLREPIDLKGQEERIIRAGPQNAGLSDYFASLKRVNEALSRLKSTNIRSNQQAISELGGLLKSGSQQLEDVFRSLLEEDSHPVEPLNYITKQKPFPVLSRDKVSQLGLINSFVATSASQTSQFNSYVTPTGQIYSDIRGPYLTSTLQNLATASVNTARKKQPDALYVRGRNNIGDYAQGLEALFLAEYDNVCSLFSREEWGRVYAFTCRNALGEFSQTLRELNSHIKTNLTTDCFLAYEIMEIVSNLATNLETKTGELKGPLSDALRPIRETAKGSLPDLIEDTRRRVAVIQSLPPDCASVSATTETMSRVQNLPDYIQPLSSLLISLGDGNWTSGNAASGAASTPAMKSFDVGADGRQLLAHFVADTIDTLLSSLESKARSFYRQNKSLIGVFLGNNTALVERMIRTSPLSTLLPASLPSIEGWRKKSVSNYLDAWRDPSSHLLDVQYTNRSHRPPSGSSNVNSAEIIKSLGSKDKDAIKEKFRGFNITFDELVSKHKSLAMEREVRAMLSREVSGLIEPLYGRFWDRYHEIDKGKGKYVKYDKSHLTQVLAALG